MVIGITNPIHPNYQFSYNRDFGVATLTESFPKKRFQLIKRWRGSLRSPRCYLYLFFILLMEMVEMYTDPIRINKIRLT